MAERPSTPAPQSHNNTNRLAAEHSPYLLQHAHNPVSVLIIFVNLYSRLCDQRVGKDKELWLVNDVFLAYLRWVFHNFESQSAFEIRYLFFSSFPWYSQKPKQG
jgi:hypothetical protein